MITKALEKDVVRCFNEFFRESGVNGYAYRNNQVNYVPEDVGVLVDSISRHFYLGIDCRSRKARDGLIFDPYFVKRITGQMKFLAWTGRMGYMVLEFRFEERGRKSTYYKGAYTSRGCL